MTDFCPCGSGLSYNDCCLPLHRGVTVAATAESLMRSRYSAFVLQLSDYLLASWAKKQRPKHLDFSNDSTQWLGLEICQTQAGGIHDKTGTVTFKARFSELGETLQLTETSRFLKRKGLWFYVDGTVSVEPWKQHLFSIEEQIE